MALSMTAARPVDAGKGQLQKLGAVAAEELRQVVRAGLTDLMERFLRDLPSALSVAALRAPNAADQRTYQELARSNPKNVPRWLETFTRHVDSRLVGGINLDQDRTKNTQLAPDDAVVIARLELRAEARYQKLITELDARLNRLRLMLYVPVYTRALAPAGLGRSLQDTADTLGWPERARRLLFEQFDASVINNLEALYGSLLEALKRIGTEAAKAARDVPAAEGLDHVAPPGAAAAPGPGVSGPIPVDPQTLAMLQVAALKTDGDGYTDGLLAADLLALADHRPLPGLGQDEGWAQLQRIALAGEFLNGAVNDPFVPREMQPQHESMRFPLVKSALTDSSLFTSKSHPLATLIHELMLKSATSRLSGDVEVRRIADMLKDVLVQFDLSPEFVRQAMLTAQPIDEGQVERFKDLQRQQAEQRRKFVISEAKRLILRELEGATFGRGVPAPATRFLQTAWGALLTKRLLQRGASDPQYKETLGVMEQLLIQLDGRKPSEPASPAWQGLMRTISETLLAEGMPKERVTESLAMLEAARKTPVSDSPF